MTSPSSDWLENLRRAISTSNEVFRLSETPKEKAMAILQALSTHLSLLRDLPNLPIHHAALDELLMALEKLETKPTEIIDDFLRRDTTNKNLLPAQELKAHILIGYQVLSSAIGMTDKAEARRETAKAYEAFGVRTVSTLSRWLTVINSDPAYDLYKQLMEIATHRGWFGLPINQAREIVKDHVAELHILL